MSKAFDKVNHRLLLSKLSSYGLSLKYCRLLDSYLSHRLNFVRVSGRLSAPFLSTSGVPQGSNLGPLLFLVFVNDLASCIKHTRLLLFADDIKLFTAVKTVDDCECLQRDIDSISAWCFSNDLLLNESKTKVMSFSRKREILSFPYVLDSTDITRVEVIRDLGVFMDPAINFNHHVTTIANASCRVLGAITRVTRGFSNPLCILRLFSSLVRSRVEYASVVWNCIGVTNSGVIESVQRRFVRVLFDRYFQPNYFYSYERICELVKLDSLHNRRTIRGLTYLYRIVNGIIDSPELLSHIFLHVPRRSSRLYTLFYPPDFYHAAPMTRLQLTYNHLEQISGNVSLDIFDEERKFRKCVETIVLS